MKKKLGLIATFLFVGLSVIYALDGGKKDTKEGYKYTFKIKGIKDTICYMAGYYGPKQYYKDTAEVNAEGICVFEGDKPLPGGIYSIVLPDKSGYFEFIINEPSFYMETEKDNLIEAMKIKGSKENQVFYDYLRFINKKAQQSQEIKNKMNAEKDEAKKEAYKKELEQIDQEVKNYKLRIINEHPDLFIAKMFKASREPEVPEAPLLPDGSKDSTFAYRYYKSHYLDGVDFSDNRLVRTPILHNKVSYYIEKLTPQIPDSIIKEADYLVEKARADKEVFKYVVHYITNTYERSKIMGMDAVFVHMAKKYYLSGDAYWVDSTQLAKIKDRAETLEPLLIGKRAPNIILQDTTEKNWVNLYQVPAKYTILYFWDSGCGHCKKTTPLLKKLYEKYKPLGVEVFAVGTEFETDDWKKYIREHNLNWINVSDNPEINKNAVKYIKYTTLESLNFRSTYDIFATPQVYLLDQDKKILAKRLSVSQLDAYLAPKLGVQPDPEGTYEPKEPAKGKKSKAKH